jgi:hypothetical protein
MTRSPIDRRRRLLADEDRASPAPIGHESTTILAIAAADARLRFRHGPAATRESHAGGPVTPTE